MPPSETLSAKYEDFGSAKNFDATRGIPILQDYLN